MIAEDVGGVDSLQIQCPHGAPLVLPPRTSDRSGLVKHQVLVLVRARLLSDLSARHARAAQHQARRTHSLPAPTSAAAHVRTSTTVALHQQLLDLSHRFGSSLIATCRPFPRQVHPAQWLAAASWPVAAMSGLMTVVALVFYAIGRHGCRTWP